MNLAERIAAQQGNPTPSWADQTLEARSDSIRAAISAQDRIISTLEHAVRVNRGNPSELKRSQLRLSSAYSYRALKFAELGPIMARTGHYDMLRAEMARHA